MPQGAKCLAVKYPRCGRKMSQDDSIHSALKAASEYLDFVKGLPDKYDVMLRQQLFSVLLNLANAMEDLMKQPLEEEVDNEYESSNDDYWFAKVKIDTAFERDFQRVAALDDATYGDSKIRLLMLDDDLADIFSNISAAIRLLSDDSSSKLFAIDHLILTYTIHWADHLYRALYSLNQLRFVIIT